MPGALLPAGCSTVLRTHESTGWEPEPHQAAQASLQGKRATRPLLPPAPMSRRGCRDMRQRPRVSLAIFPLEKRSLLLVSFRTFPN